MKAKSINLKVFNITPKQWSNLVIELNLVAQAWKPYGPVIKIKTHNLVAPFCNTIEKLKK